MVLLPDCTHFWAFVDGGVGDDPETEGDGRAVVGLGSGAGVSGAATGVSQGSARSAARPRATGNDLAR